MNGRAGESCGTLISGLEFCFLLFLKTYFNNIRVCACMCVCVHTRTPAHAWVQMPHPALNFYPSSSQREESCFLHSAAPASRSCSSKPCLMKLTGSHTADSKLDLTGKWAGIWEGGGDSTVQGWNGHNTPCSATVWAFSMPVQVPR